MTVESSLFKTTEEDDKGSSGETDLRTHCTVLLRPDDTCHITLSTAAAKSVRGGKDGSHFTGFTFGFSCLRRQGADAWLNCLSII